MMACLSAKATERIKSRYTQYIYEGNCAMTRYAPSLVPPIMIEIAINNRMIPMGSKY